MKMKTHSWLIFGLATFALSLSAQASKLRSNYVHPDKMFQVESLRVAQQSEVSRDQAADCSVGCSEVCVSLAKRILSDCNGNNSGVNSPDFQSCLDSMKSFFAQRTGTSGDQDRADAIAYCASGASASCATELHSNFLNQRTGTSGEQDRSDAARACQNGVSLSCVKTIYAEYSKRNGTSKTQDLNDSVAACQRKAAF